MRVYARPCWLRPRVRPAPQSVLLPDHKQDLGKNRRKKKMFVCDLTLSPGKLPLTFNIGEDFRCSEKSLSELEGTGCRVGVFPMFPLLRMFRKWVAQIVAIGICFNFFF